MLKRLAAGDAHAFRVTVARFTPQLAALARRMLRDDAEAEDIVQEALVRLWRNAATLELGPYGLRPWLRRVVSNLCIDRMRSAKPVDVTGELPEVPEPATQLRTIEARETSARVTEALRALPDRQRVALTLFHFEGLSQIEVGQMLAISDEAVESLLARARRTLKVALKDEWRSLLPSAEEG
ncbi:MAG: sigma-70 family RNA polymerase sigma factor [Hyphomicrobiaceae bacterium]